MRPEELPTLLGEWGRFQRRLMALFALPLIFVGVSVMIVVVVLYVPRHRCVIPGLDNDSFQLQSQWHRAQVDAAIPSIHMGDGHQTYEQCRIYVSRRNASDGNITRKNQGVYELREADTDTVLETISPRTEVDDTVECSDWVYDDSEFQSTVISQFNLVCGKKDFRAHVNMAYMIGALIGSPFTGFLCDWAGRKLVFYVFLALGLVTAMVSAFSPFPTVFLICRFLLGLEGIAIYLSLYVLAMELVGPTKRNRAGALIALLWLLGPFLVAALSNVIRDWWILQLVCTAPLCVCLSYWWLIPESPRWLLSKGRTLQAVGIIRKVARVNKISLPPVLGKFEDQKDPEQDTPRESPLRVLKYPVLVVRTLIIFFNWAVVSMTYYGLSLNVSNLGGSVRVNFLLSNIVELVGYCAAWLLLDRLGRKRFHCAAMLLSGSACLTTIFTVTFGGPEIQWVTTALAMVGKLGISGAFSSVYLVSAELFPTIIRNSGMGCSSTVARVGSAMSPYIADLALYIEGSFGQALPLIIFGTMALAAGLLSLLLPETLGHTLPDTLEEAANFGKNREEEVGEELSQMTTNAEN